MEPVDVCTICGKSLKTNSEKVVTVREKGLSTLIKKSKEKNDDKWRKWSAFTSLPFHEGCRKRYAVSSGASFARTQQPARPSTSAAGDPTSTCSIDPSLHLEASNFNFHELCVICGNNWDRIHKAGSVVKNDYVKDRIMSTAALRGDNKGEMVKQRLRGISSLIDVRARYHTRCYNEFFVIPSENPIGRPIDPDLEVTFARVCERIEEGDKSQFLLSELQAIMGENCPANKTLYRKLRTKYGNDIYISQSSGKEPVIYYKIFNLSQICQEWLCDDKSLGELQKKHILEVAAGILRSEILAAEYNTKSYNAPAKFLNTVVKDIPNSLTTFLGNLIFSRNTNDEDICCAKCDSIAHAIVCAVRPKSFISHLQLSVGSYIYRKTGSRLIIDLLAKLGVCASYHSVQLLEASTMLNPPEMKVTEDVHVQYVFDNTDHNVSTLDGHRTFHCLGGIAVYTPEHEISYEGQSEKCAQIPHASTLASLHTIETVPIPTVHESGLKKIEFVNTNTLLLGESASLPPTYSTYLWAKYFAVSKLPSWRGYMEVLSRDSSYSVSNIRCLPFINEPPSKLTTIHTALQYALEETKKLNQQTCFVTFDQPLYIKARDIVAALEDKGLKNIVVILGGFHTLMSYLASIGYVMEGSGLEDLWSVVYAPESVKRMMTGKAFSRSVRAHILTYTALGMIICKSAGQDHEEEYKQFIATFLENWEQDPPHIGDCGCEAMITGMTDTFLTQLHNFKKRGPTAQLWIQYFECVTIILQFIEAARLGDWKLHLQSVHKMLPLFHAAGHFAYAKSAQIYLQDMAQLEIVMNDDEFRKFTKEAYFTIRRSDKSWSGIWSDMTIEQTLNRFFGTDLKHGRGVTPSVVAKYLASMPAFFNIMENLEDYCGINSRTSEQHVDLSASRMQKDEADIAKFLFWLNEHDVFAERSSLMSLSTGIIGAHNINCHQALAKGQASMTTMIGKNAQVVSLSFQHKVKNLASAKGGIHINNKYQSVNTRLLFQRISVVLQGNEELTRQALQYELSPFPLSLFDDKGFMRKTNKADLYKVFKTSLCSEALLDTFTFVVDGGFLLHKVIWPHGKTYNDICHIYLMYITKHYGKHAWVVFDGYNNELLGVKSYERFRRQEKNVAADINFESDMLVTLSQTKFLSNICNKQKFVTLLAQYLKERGVNVRQASEDADTLIVQTALELRQRISEPVAIIGNDVDLFVLLIALTPETDNMYFYKIAPSNKKNSLYSTASHKDLKPFILFGHAICGCDTTSAFYGKGKKSVMNLIAKNSDLQEIAQVFCNQQSSETEICTAGEKFLLFLYSNNKQQQCLGELRYKRFVSLALQASTEIRLAQLPPTKSAFHQHVKRVYYQIQRWLGNPIDAEKWGWMRKDDLMLPVMSTEEPAPQKLLELIVCGCQTSCQTKRCGCKNAGLRCSQFCKFCNGVSCTNAAVNPRSGASDRNRNQEKNNEEEDNEEQFDNNTFFDFCDDIEENNVHETDENLQGIEMEF